MISRGFTGRRARSAAPRVGLFGLLGSGNIGNDASMESVLGYLSTEHPDAIVDALQDLAAGMGFFGVLFGILGGS